MSDANQRRAEQLSMPYGTACHRLRKLVLFDLLRRHGENICYRCGGPIQTVEELSLEHKNPWENVNASLFWDLDNIGFSHHACNCAAANRRLAEHGSTSKYRAGCRCAVCKAAATAARMSQYRKYGRRYPPRTGAADPA